LYRFQQEAKAMNITLIFAGGSGIRMNSAAKPKQFLQLYGKEIIIHTIENFEKHSDIDGVVVVCIEAWIPFFKGLIEKFNIKKIMAVIPGGITGQESIYKGLVEIQKNCPDDDTVVLIHDGVRPLIDSDLISRCINSVLVHGSAITVTPAIETIVSLDTDNKIASVTDRFRCFYAKAPQCFKLGDIISCHQKALANGFNNIIDSASLMRQCGYDLYTVEGSYENIKITTPSDYYIFRALFEAKENSQIFGI
jgi:2-C-methyl-D-erythritol 4-phosphate cytidylyltransferase